MRDVFVSAYLAGVAWLLAWEIAALVKNPDYTISRLWWQVEGPGWTAAKYGTLAFLVFVTGHLVWGLFR